MRASGILSAELSDHKRQVSAATQSGDYRSNPSQRRIMVDFTLDSTVKCSFRIRAFLESRLRCGANPADDRSLRGEECKGLFYFYVPGLL